MVGSSVYLFKSEIIVSSDELTNSELLNYLLVDETLGEIGLIEQIDNYSGNIVLTVNFRGKELLVPFNDELLIHLDKHKKILTLRFPEGLLDD